MKKLLIIPAAFLLFCLLASCGGKVEPVTIAETTTEAITTTEAETTTVAPPESTQQITRDLLDFALIDRLFSMTYADFCREEGRTVEPEGMYDGGVYCYFSKYGDSTPFFFDYAEPIADNDLLNVVYMKAPDLLVDRQDLTLGELKQWLNEKGVVCQVNKSEDLYLRFYFEWEKYEFMGDLASEKDNTPVLGFEVYCKSNYDNHIT